MATCPHCGGFLGERHHCEGLWPRRARRVGGSTLAMLGGVVLSMAVLYLVSNNPSSASIALGVVACASPIFRAL
jgi:hypothetical protein